MSPNQSTIKPVVRSGGSTPFYIFALFGDYIIPYKQSKAWTQELIYLLELLGLPQRTTRTTLGRMKSRGWFETYQEGRRSQYQLTPSGTIVLEQGRRRIFEPVPERWNERWQVVVYSLPEEKRALRDEFRKKLVWFGFGNLAGGTWVTTHDRLSELEGVTAGLGIDEYVTMFDSKSIGRMTNQQIVEKCWDLESLENDYAAFVSHWEPRFQQFSRSGPWSDEQSFQESFWLTYDFQPFPRKDPNLPLALLPSHWPGHRARQLYSEYRELLREQMPRFFKNLSASS